MTALVNRIYERENSELDPLRSVRLRVYPARKVVNERFERNYPKAFLPMAVNRQIKKLVLAYSGGLDTSVILRWLKDYYDCEIIAYCADVGQAEEISGLEDRALGTGASKLCVADLREE